MLLRGHRDFSFDAPFVARCDFTFNGVEYKSGASFPWSDLGVSKERLWELWGGRAIDNVSASAPALVPNAPFPPAQPKVQGRAARR